MSDEDLLEVYVTFEGQKYTTLAPKAAESPYDTIIIRVAKAEVLKRMRKGS